MSQKLSVLVQVDLDGHHVTIRVTGTLTMISQQGLPPLIRRARTLTPGIRVTVDLTMLTRVEAAAVGLLHEALDEAEPTGQGGQVHLLWPEPTAAARTGMASHPDAQAGAGPAVPSSSALSLEPVPAVTA